MKVSYKGVEKELPPKMQQKLDARFSKLSKFLERRGEKGAHVVVTNERHLNKAEITVQYYDHQLVGVGADGDLFTALMTALERLEKQAVKLRSKWREKGRRGESAEARQPRSSAAEPREPAAQRVFRVNHHERRKPMTLEEALLEMGQDRDYLVYRDAEKNRTSMLVRRRDGHIDLIES